MRDLQDECQSEVGGVFLGDVEKWEAVAVRMSSPGDHPLPMTDMAAIAYGVLWGGREDKVQCGRVG